MRPRLAIAFALIVLIPIALLSWLGVRLVRSERQNVERRIRELYEEKLADIDQSIQRLLRDREAELLRLTELSDPDASALRERTRETPFVAQMFLIEPEGRIAYPSPDDSLSAAEREFLERAREVLTKHLPQTGRRTEQVELAAVAESFAGAPADTLREEKKSESIPMEREERFALSDRQGEPKALSSPTRKRVASKPASSIILLPTPSPIPRGSLAPLDVSGMGQDVRRPAASSLTMQQAASLQAVPAPQVPLPGDHGWYVWFWGRGIHMIFWRLDEAGRIVGAELDRVRFLADVIGLLPETQAQTADGSPGRLVLCDGLGEVVYQWGAYDPAPEERPVAERALAYPLSAWSLRQFVPSGSLESFGSGGILLNAVVAAIVAGLAFLVVAIFFYRESTRELREAAQRVSFVNQVSHELKTPLTNIRMYAELLEAGLDEEDVDSRERLGVVVSESRRLSRLIGNILSFSRRQRSKLTVRPQPCVMDEIVRSTLAGFEAAFEEDGISVEFDAGAGETVMADQEALEQILGNLLSNVEKYAADGGWVGIKSRREDDRVVVRVSDRGPGIPKHMADRVFEPFQRGSDRLTEGVSGTGIGLAIARDLARLHGGDLRVADSKDGACFELRIEAPPVTHGGNR